MNGEQNIRGFMMKKHTKNYMMLIMLSTGFIMAVLDTTGVALAIPNLEVYLQLSTLQSAWLINVYILGLGGTLLLSGNLSIKFGDKRLFLTGMFLFACASAVCGLSVCFPQLLFFRFLQGVGASLFMPSAMSLLFNAYGDAKIRAKVLGIWTAIISVATGIGSLVGGFFITSFGWRSIFFINVPLSMIAIVYIYMTSTNVVRVGRKSINYFDNILLTMSIGTVILYLTIGKQLGYLSYQSLGCLLSFIVLLSIVILRERRTKNPIVPFILLRNIDFLTANLFGFIVNVSLYGLVIIFGLYYQSDMHYSAMVSGLLILPGMIILVVGNIFYTRIIKFIPVSKLIKYSISIAILGSLILMFVSILTTKRAIILVTIGFAVLSFGIGMLTPASTTLLMESAGSELSSVAGATLNANKQIGGLFGTAIVSVIVSFLVNQWQLILSVFFIVNLLLYAVAYMIQRNIQSH